MNIFIIHLGRKGGGPAYTLEIAKCLHNAGEKVTVLLSSNIEMKAQYDKQPFRVEYFKTYNSFLGFLYSVFTLYRIIRVIRYLNKSNADLVYSTMIHMWDPILFPLIKKQRIKTIHDVEPHEGTSLFVRMIQRSQFSSAEKFVILSYRYEKILLAHGIKNTQYAVVPHAGYTYFSDFGRTKTEMALNPTALIFGRIVKYKGLDVLLEAMNIVKTKIPNAKLRIVGSGDLTPYQKNLLLLKDNIELHNVWIKDEELTNYVSDVDFLVAPYIHATQSGSTPIAYAFAKPIIVTTAGCLSEQVVDGVTGYVVEKSNPKALAEKMIFLMTNREKTKQMGRDAFDYMQKNMTWESTAQKLKELFYRAVKI